MKIFWHTTFYAIFWLWNLIFLMLIYTVTLPIIGIPLVTATLRGDIPWEFSLTFASLIAIPTVCTFIGGSRFTTQPVQLIRLFYGIEAPLFVLCLLRLFIFRELTPATAQIFGATILCIAAFCRELYWGYAERRQTGLQWLQMLAHSLILILGIYGGAILLFYALPFAGYFIQALIQTNWAQELSYIFNNPYWFSALWSYVIGLMFFVFSTTLFIFMPPALAGLYIHSGVKILRLFAAEHGKTRTFTGASAVLVSVIIIFLSFQQQPQTLAFSLLKNPPATDSDRQALLAKSNEIRIGLVNAYLSSYRYLSNVAENNHISVMYQEALGLNKSVANQLQGVYNFLMSPFLYQGSEEDAQKAEKLYAEFFDNPIQKVEKAAISHAVQSTYNQEEVKAGLLNINQKKVWLESQQVTVKEHGDWADVELYEVYKNQTQEVQEIFYSFSLPESAVITGLWLGDTSDRSQRFLYVVSPRGAAQKVYNSQVRRERPIDPALLEQVGPRHYRLRAFPIPPKNVIQLPGQPPRPTEMHLWLTYQVMRKNQGWAMPNLGEKRNIYWNNSTKRLRNNQEINFQKDAWLEDFLPASGKFEPIFHEVNVQDGYNISVRPLSAQDYIKPENKRFALILDTSRSMGEHVSELSKTWQWLKANGFADNILSNNDADLFITASKGAKPQRLDDINQFQAEKATFYGTIQPQEMIQQFNQLRGDTAYNAVLLLSDQGSYELSKNNKTVPISPAPLWMVHLGGLPAAYDDGIIKSIQDSGGGVATEITEVLQRIATKSALGDSVVSVVDGYAWYWQKINSQVDNVLTQGESDFQKIAVRQLILALSKQIKLDNLQSLDAIHSLAKRYGIVSPYSSMLVLVNDEQRRLLKEAEAQSDRFDRKIENGKEDLTKPNNPLKVSTPEPSGGWILGVSVIAVLIFVKRRSINLKLRNQ
ncbi:MAG TPA: TIGR02921 family PEP-CTERM protein [Nostocaceae cyanobacterium]|nr:TIGR02921 family PEP-CTERM protein [Nostocaceae cyanobacterium]